MMQYTQCGLGNVWLVNGFRLRAMGGGTVLQVRRPERLAEEITKVALSQLGRRIQMRQVVDADRRLWPFNSDLGAAVVAPAVGDSEQFLLAYCYQNGDWKCTVENWFPM